MTVLDVHELTYHPKGQKILGPISLHFKAGCFYGILGSNGSGKTTLLKNLSAILTPSSGNVFWEGKPLFAHSRKELSRILSFVPQAAFVPFDYSVEQIVEMGFYSVKGQSKSKLEEVLHKVDVQHLRHQPITQLSSGERQRVYIARALATNAPIILLDEPTSHLDLRHQIVIWKLLREIAEESRIVIAAVHDLIAVRQYCDEVVVLERGKSLASGKYSEVITDELLCNVFGVRRSAEGFVEAALN